MEKVRIEALKPGMILAKTIYGIDGRVLVRDRVQITPVILEKLKELGLPAAYIKTGADDPVIADPVSEATRMDLVKSLSKLDTQVRAGGNISLASSKRPLYDLVDEIVNNKNNLIGMTDIRLHDDYTFGHSVNVAIITVKIGLLLDYNQLKLADLAVGSLFHDIGMTKIALEILNKQKELTGEELKIIQTHPEIGYNILRQNQDVSTVSAHVALQHHERYNGTGYPRGITGDTIHEFARIVAVADTFDSLTTERIFRHAKTIPEALIIIEGKKGTDFDPQMVELFMKVIDIDKIASTY
jgi:HD-GYP domain-containing protein (c-di-GMP phosphodiesterase class II)